MHQPDSAQVTGTICGTLCSIFMAPEWDIAKGAIIGATVGFIVTTILRVIWENFRHKYEKRFPFLKKK